MCNKAGNPSLSFAVFLRVGVKIHQGDVSLPRINYPSNVNHNNNIFTGFLEPDFFLQIKQSFLFPFLAKSSQSDPVSRFNKLTSKAGKLWNDPPLKNYYNFKNGNL